MKIITFFAIVATVSAITIQPSTTSDCEDFDIPSISDCGDTPIPDYNIASAKIVYDDSYQRVTWFQQEDGSSCQGRAYPVDRRDDLECFQSQFTPRCVRITC